MNTLGIKFSILHPFLALLARPSEWLLNHLVRSDFQVEAEHVWSRHHHTHATLEIQLRRPRTC